MLGMLGRQFRFQSTLPVWGATRLKSPYMRGVDVFQSTLPVWGATAENHNKYTIF